MTTFKYLLFVVLLFTSVFIPSSFGEARTLTKEYAHRACDADSKITSRAIALDQAKKLLAEEKGADYAG